MKKITLLLLLTLSVFGLQAQTTYQLNYDSIRVNKTAGTGGTSLYGKVYLKNSSAGITYLNADKKIIGNSLMTFSNDSTITYRGQKFIQNVSTSQFPTRYSTIFGYGAGQNFKLGTQGYANSLFGFGAGAALQSNVASEASSNSIFGDSSGGGITTGTANSIFGTVSAATGNFTKVVSIGWHSMLNATYGDESTVIGSYALPSNTAQSPQTVVGALSFYNNTSGKRLVGLGYYAGGTNVSGNDLTIIGSNSDAYNDVSRSIAIGTEAIVDRSRMLNIGNAIYANGIDTIPATSVVQLGIGVSNPTGGVHIRASDGTVGTAPIKINQGILLTDKEPGSFEFDGNQIYMTNSASTRQTIAYISNLAGYQDSLISGTNIKTINSTSLLGSGNITTGDALVANPLSQFAATTSSQLRGVISDETGTGALMFNSSPTITGGNGNQLVLDNAGETYTQLTWKNNTVTKAADYWDNSAARKISAVAAVEILGQGGTGSRLQIMQTPTTSAGSYDVLTRNSSTGAIEKVASNPITSGFISLSGNASATTFDTTIEEFTTDKMILQATSSEAAKDSYLIRSAGTWQIVFLTAPATGTNNITFHYIISN